MQQIKFDEWLWKRLNRIEQMPCSLVDVQDWINDLTKNLTEVGRHFGECTNQNVHCKLCELEFYLKKYKQETVEKNN